MTSQTNSTPEALANPPRREQTPVDALAEEYVASYARLNPLAATSMGIAGHDHEMSDLSPAGLEALARLDRETLVALDATTPTDEIDTVTIEAMRERLGIALELHDAAEDLASLNNIASPLQELREVFDLMPTGTPEAWENIAARLNALPGAMRGYIASLRAGAARGRVSPIRQVLEGVRQAKELAEPSSSFFATLLTGPEIDRVLDGSGSCEAIRKELHFGSRAAIEAYGDLAHFLAEELAPQAPHDDAAGPERYALWSRYFLGASVDLQETYAWGLAELARIADEQGRVAEIIAGPGASVHDAVAQLDKDPARTLHGTDELRAWMQETSDAALAALQGTHFDIPGPVQDLQCMIAPTQDGGIYYTGPSDDFSRPGQMWWSVPPSVTEFNTWRELTTVYHEGVPGHHLQVAQAVYQRGTLNSWRRLMSWSSGHGEGWALYAEQLMAEFGFLDDPGDLLGMLDAQRMRAARVVFDIGVHLRLRAPQEWGGQVWNAENGWDFLRANINMPEDFIRFELNRYLGWPGQAPSYKVGQRLWEEIREDSRTRAEDAGQTFDLRAFHARALNMGSVGLDVLREALG